MLGLHETVCTGAADGYARMARAPAAVLLHLGPGLANGLANLHNARRARTPVLCLVGQMVCAAASGKGWKTVFCMAEPYPVGKICAGQGHGAHGPHGESGGEVGRGCFGWYCGKNIKDFGNGLSRHSYHTIIVCEAN